jgi:hypothetical protein
MMQLESPLLAHLIALEIIVLNPVYCAVLAQIHGLIGRHIDAKLDVLEIILLMFQHILKILEVDAA